MKIKKVTVYLKEHGPDEIAIHTNLPSTMSKISNDNAIFTIFCERGAAIEYTKRNFPNTLIEISDPWNR